MRGEHHPFEDPMSHLEIADFVSMIGSKMTRARWENSFRKRGLNKNHVPHVRNTFYRGLDKLLFSTSIR